MNKIKQLLTKAYNKIMKDGHPKTKETMSRLYNNMIKDKSPQTLLLTGITVLSVFAMFVTKSPFILILSLVSLIGAAIYAFMYGDKYASLNIAKITNFGSFIGHVLYAVRNAANGRGIASLIEIFNAGAHVAVNESLNREYSTLATN